MRRLQPIVERFEVLDDREDLEPYQVSRLRDKWRAMYRDMTGVEITQHAELKRAAEHAAETGDIPISQLIHDLRAGMLNRLEPPSSSSSGSGSVSVAGSG